ncbi:fasting-inducible integral membrane protein tm6p1-related [Anaeramoeba flamelloides]|uniref:Fasting-inducible integral membrane protein tm6p1-related n=1 Tax=Anaeramoeba flamelloides TaxID=1746091 RepID=A0ABQ8XBU0_9EUKA|nr:fasting-inducible integral membrane protein tm6p1-related [Anaeramoeba flamelloides]
MKNKTYLNVRPKKLLRIAVTIISIQILFSHIVSKLNGHVPTTLMFPAISSTQAFFPEKVFCNIGYFVCGFLFVLIEIMLFQKNSSLNRKRFPAMVNVLLLFLGVSVSICLNLQSLVSLPKSYTDKMFQQVHIKSRISLRTRLHFIFAGVVYFGVFMHMIVNLFNLSFIIKVKKRSFQFISQFALFVLYFIMITIFVYCQNQKLSLIQDGLQLSFGLLNLIGFLQHLSVIFMILYYYFLVKDLDGWLFVLRNSEKK